MQKLEKEQQETVIQLSTGLFLAKSLHAQQPKHINEGFLPLLCYKYYLDKRTHIVSCDTG